jgi:hypothetical protein
MAPFLKEKNAGFNKALQDSVGLHGFNSSGGQIEEVIRFPALALLAFAALR